MRDIEGVTIGFYVLTVGDFRSLWSGKGRCEVRCTRHSIPAKLRKKRETYTGLLQGYLLNTISNSIN